MAQSVRETKDEVENEVVRQEFKEPPKVIKGASTDEDDEGRPKVEAGSGEDAGDAGNEVDKAKTPPLYRGLTKNIMTQEELLDYTRQLERDVVEKDAKLAVGTGLQSKTENDSETKTKTKTDVSDLQTRLLIDPESVLDEVKKDAIKTMKDEAKAQADAEAKSKAFWDSFYAENPDIQNNNELVQFVLFQNKEELDRLPLNQSKAELARLTRSYINKVLEGREKKELLTDSQTPETTGSPTGVIPRAPKAYKPQTMSDQMRQINGPKMGLHVN